MTAAIRQHPLAGSLYILLGAIGFSSKAILIKLAYAEDAGLDAITLMAWRMLLSLPFFALVAVLSHEPDTHHSRGDWGGIIGLGIIGYYLASYLDFYGLQYISAGLERLILFLYPGFVLLFSALYYRKPFNRYQLLAIILSYCGILLVFDSDQESEHLLLGAGLVLASALVFAVFITASGHFIPRFGSRRFTAYSMTIACLATLSHFALTQPLGKLWVSPRVMLISLVIALFATVAPAFLINAGIQRIGADRSAILSTIGPVSTLIMGYYILHDPLGPLQIIGSALVICGVTLVSMKK